MCQSPAAEQFDSSSLKRDDRYLVDLGRSVWLMDNHKWALYVWEKFRQKSGIKKFTLLHADYHWDGVYELVGLEREAGRLRLAGPNELHEIIEKDEWVRYDSFIAPAVVRDMFDTIHFHCRQHDGSDVGVNEGIRQPTGTRQVIHESADTFNAIQPTSPLIFDLCLDLFNSSQMFEEGDLWPDAEIVGFLEKARPLITEALLVTISLSFDYSGTSQDTKHLASLVVPIVLEWRSELRLLG